MKIIARKILIISVLCEVFAGILFSQNGDHINGGRFTKTIEFNLGDSESGYNFNGKGKVEMQLFGDFNAPVEFFVNPSFPKFDIHGGFRLIKDSSINKYIFEVKLIVDEKIKIQRISISDEFADKFYNKMVWLIKNFKARSTLPIEYDGYKIVSQEKMGINDGDNITFRTVVEDEVWSLKIHVPNGNAGKMAYICREILKLANNNKINEAYYTKLLDDF